jgi:hypothetical protein
VCRVRFVESLEVSLGPAGAGRDSHSGWISSRGAGQLHQVLRNEWSVLDGMSGENLLFFAPVDPPEAWIADPSISGRPTMQLLRKQIWFGADRVSQERHLLALVSQDPSATTSAFRQLLGVPPGMGSCVVIARDLNAQEVWLMSTDERRIGAQLERLGAIANWDARQPLPTEPFVSLLSRLSNDFESIVEALDLPVSLAAMLTDMCAMTALQGDSHDGRIGAMTQRRAQEQLRSSVQLRLAAGRAVSDQEAHAQLAQTTVLLTRASRVASLQQQTVRRRSVRYESEDRASMQFRVAEQQADEASPADSLILSSCQRTNQLLRTGNDCLMLTQAGVLGSREHPDYRLAISSWCQALEHEMAELLGHEVRAGLGIELPEFHWRKQPDKRDVTIECAAHNGPISFNQARAKSPDQDRALWQPPAMGPLRLGWETWRARIGIPAPRELSELLIRCKDIRNLAAHPSDPMPLELAHQAQLLTLRAIEMVNALGIRNWGVSQF